MATRGHCFFISSMVFTRQRKLRAIKIRIQVADLSLKRCKRGGCFLGTWKSKNTAVAGGPIGGRLPSVVLDAFPNWAHETRRLAVVHQCIDLLQWPLPGHSPWPLRPRTLHSPLNSVPTPCRPPSSSRRWNGTRQVETWEFVEPSNPVSLPSPSQPIPSTVAVSTPALS